jgi:crotonobetainyl-CoA:carnitine CoA-transferase CaiB-like acyl-CoA transferase
VVTLPDGALRGRVHAIGLPFALGDGPGREVTAPPAMGEHTREVLAELGM